MKQHADSMTAELGADKKWDYVVLQDFSTGGATWPNPSEGVDWRVHCGATQTDKFCAPAAKDLIDAINATGARTIFYQTYGTFSKNLREWDESSPKTVKPLGNFTFFNDRLIKGYGYYAELAQGSDPLTIPAAEAWRQLWDNQTEDEQALLEKDRNSWNGVDTLFSDLYAPDHHHPSQLGAYFVSCLLYYTLIDEKSELPMPSGIDQTKALKLQEVAWQLVRPPTAAPTPAPTDATASVGSLPGLPHMGWTKNWTTSSADPTDVASSADWKNQGGPGTSTPSSMANLSKDDRPDSLKSAP